LSRPPILVLVLTGAFVLLVASLLIGSFTTPELPPYRLGATGDTLYTLDASRGDTWRRFDFARGMVVDSGRWDIAFRRNRIITAPGVGAADFGPTPFDSVDWMPTQGYTQTLFSGDSTNHAVGAWYAYSMWSHLLTPKHHVYGVQTSAGDYVKFEILAYYCRDVGSACYTMRYKKTRPRATESPGGAGAR
jgi:hypothetical protein